MQIERTGIEDIAHIHNRQPGQKNATKKMVELRKRRNAADVELEEHADRDFIEMMEREA